MSGTDPQPLLAVDDLKVSYGSRSHRTPALHGVSFSMVPGEKISIVGESGSGKSTTAHALIGLLPAGGRIDSGAVSFAGRDLTRLGDRALRAVRGAEIGLIPQDPMTSLNPVRRIGKQVEEALAVHGRAGRGVERRVLEGLRDAGLPDPERVAAQFPHELSGGMRQRVLIAIALACSPRLVIADEPTSALDVTVQRQILDHIDRVTAAEGTSMLLITHDLGVAGDRTDRIIVMNEGEIVEDGPADSVLGSPADAYTKRLLAAAPSLSSRVLYSGQTVATAETAAAGPLVSVRALRKEFHTAAGSHLAVDDVSFDIAAGETLAIVGESGSGKSTTARLLLQLEKADAGSVTLDGAELTGLSAARIRPHRLAMQMVYQSPYASLSPRFSVGDIISEPLRIHRIASAAERRRIAASLLDQVALPGSVLDRSPAELSGGQRQRVAIARALAPQPKLIVCDEAVSALDVSVQAQVLELLAEIQRERGVAYLFISHDLAVVRQIAHRVVVMRRGRVVEQGDTEATFAHPVDEYTRQLLDAIPGRQPVST
ncbi:ABC transporter ATP-binding protein [Herbiconiux moechotypicola]|uniref:ABC transporter ATP-binding protein n=1 Tax=Herbiconiux moechotypicola TaxID=637393 RepID=A0ABN3DSL0_9MICO|nr:ABC transporter ATP-binding protein [Herbiconiux moechotypicola]MCS5730599.1 ABC transporter ATP-binding protein [Herbiconiux moechotypicola]